MQRRAVDIFLALVIAASVGFIGYRILRPKVTPPPQMAATVPAAPVAQGTDLPQVPTATPEPTATPVIAYGRAQDLVLSFKKFTPAEWTAITSGPLRPFVLQETAACKNARSEQIKAFPVLLADVVAAVRAGNVRIFYEGGFGCYRVGDTMAIAAPSRLPERRPIAIIGNVKVESIIELNKGKVTAEMLKGLGPDPAEILQMFEVGKISRSGRMNLVRTSEFVPFKGALVAPVAFFPRVQVLSARNLQGWLQQNPAAIYIDVRSEDEVKKVPIRTKRRMLNVPYRTDDGNNTFRHERLNAEVRKDNFDIPKLMSFLAQARTQGVATMVIVGNGSIDGRAYWALQKLTDIVGDTNKIAWVYDGVPALNSLPASVQ